MCPNRLCHSLVRVGHRTWSREVAGLQLSYPKPCGRDEIVNLTIEVATAPDTLPEWRGRDLPDRYARIGSAARHKKKEASLRSSNPVQRQKRLRRVRSGAQCPPKHH